jgi:tRNA(Arg) A34 adenosine deaminase TadA
MVVLELGKFNRLLKMARKKAQFMTHKRGQTVVVALVLDSKNKVISFGRNSYCKTHPKQFFYAKKAGKSEKQYLHAEIHAILSSSKGSKLSKIFIARFLSDGSVSTASPCEICMAAIKDTKIKTIISTIPNGICIERK